MLFLRQMSAEKKMCIAVSDLLNSTLYLLFTFLFECWSFTYYTLSVQLPANTGIHRGIIFQLIIVEL